MMWSSCSTHPLITLTLLLQKHSMYNSVNTIPFRNTRTWGRGREGELEGVEANKEHLYPSKSVSVSLSPYVPRFLKVL